MNWTSIDCQGPLDELKEPTAFQDQEDRQAHKSVEFNQANKLNYNNSNSLLISQDKRNNNS